MPLEQEEVKLQQQEQQAQHPQTQQNKKNRNNNNNNNNRRKGPQRDPIIQLSTYIGKRLYITFIGGSAVEGRLEGYDSLMNLVLEDVQEMEAPDVKDPQFNHYDKIVVKGQMLSTLEPTEGGERLELANKQSVI